MSTIIERIKAFKSRITAVAAVAGLPLLGFIVLWKAFCVPAIVVYPLMGALCGVLVWLVCRPNTEKYVVKAPPEPLWIGVIGAGVFVVGILLGMAGSGLGGTRWMAWVFGGGVGLSLALFLVLCAKLRISAKWLGVAAALLASLTTWQALTFPRIVENRVQEPLQPVIAAFTQNDYANLPDAVRRLNRIRGDYYPLMRGNTKFTEKVSGRMDVLLTEHQANQVYLMLAELFATGEPNIVQLCDWFTKMEEAITAGEFAPVVPTQAPAQAPATPLPDGATPAPDDRAPIGAPTPIPVPTPMPE